MNEKYSNEYQEVGEELKHTKKEKVFNNETGIADIKKEKWYNKLFNRIKNIFNKKNNNKLTNEENKQNENQKSDGTPYAKMFDEEKKQVDNLMKELEEKIGFDDDDEEIEFEKNNADTKQNLEINKLEQLIEEYSDLDPFWADCLKNYFKKVNKTEKEKFEFLSNLTMMNITLFNEFKKEIVNPINVDEIFEKYKEICDNNIKDYYYYKQNDTDLIWWIRNTEQKGEMLFTFDKKRIFNLFRDYPQNLSKEQKEIFDKENPYWRNFFKSKE